MFCPYFSAHIFVQVSKYILRLYPKNHIFRTFLMKYRIINLDISILKIVVFENASVYAVRDYAMKI